MNTKSLVAFLSLALCCASAARAQTLEWIRHGIPDTLGVSADGLGNVYISGDPEDDAFVGKYDDSGTLQWTQKLGTSERDGSSFVSADGLGNVYISGSTSGSLGGPNAGGSDAFLAMYDASGSLQWTRQLGTSESDGASCVSADGLGNIYISGSTRGSLGGPNAGDRDAFISKYDTSGSLQWSRQLGTGEDDRGRGVSADGLGNVYISGTTGGTLGGTNAGYMDAFIGKYDASGSLQWIRQLGTNGWDWSFGVSADGLGNVYISGETSGSLGGNNAGYSDAFVSKYDASGTLEWTRQLGTSDQDLSHGVSADALGNVYITGTTSGSLGGPSAGDFDTFVSKYDTNGTLQWTQQFGTSEFDSSWGVSTDGVGNVYISGTLDVLSSSGDFLAKFVDLTAVPEPSGVLLLLAALGLSLTGPISRNAPRAG